MEPLLQDLLTAGCIHWSEHWNCNFDKLLEGEITLAWEWETTVSHSLGRLEIFVDLMSKISSRLSYWRFKEYSFYQWHGQKNNHHDYIRDIFYQKGLLSMKKSPHWNLISTAVSSSLLSPPKIGKKTIPSEKHTWRSTDMNPIKIKI